jgi:hypothetical protein
MRYPFFASVGNDELIGVPVPVAYFMFFNLLRAPDRQML